MEITQSERDRLLRERDGDRDGDGEKQDGNSEPANEGGRARNTPFFRINNSDQIIVTNPRPWVIPLFLLQNRLVNYDTRDASPFINADISGRAEFFFDTWRRSGGREIVCATKKSVNEGMRETWKVAR